MLAFVLVSLAASYSIAINPVSASSQDSWVAKAPMSTARTDLGTAVVKGKVFAIGGDGGGYFTILSANEQYTPFGYGTVPPNVQIVSPENKTYTLSSVSLAFAVNKPALWMGYSLDGQDNVTITGNTTLSGLSNGLHNITVYARDEFGNTGASETVYFAIATPQPVPTTLVAVASGVAIIAVSLLIYLKKQIPYKLAKRHEVFYENGDTGRRFDWAYPRLPYEAATERR